VKSLAVIDAKDERDDTEIENKRKHFFIYLFIYSSFYACSYKSYDS
jgi:hypothetical protein